MKTHSVIPHGEHFLAIALVVVLLPWPANAAMLNFSDPVNYPVGTAPVAVAVGDFNGDEKFDLAVANSGSNDVSILLGNGDGTFQQAKSYSVGTSPVSVSWATLTKTEEMTLLSRLETGRLWRVPV